MTINRSLQYLVTEEIEEQDILQKAPKARTLLHTYFLIISMHSVRQETFFSVANNGEMRGGVFKTI